jgi:hypothetical protein
MGYYFPMTYAELPKRDDRFREVYFLQAQSGGRIKIGVSKDAAKRVASLRTSSPEPVEVVGLMVCNEGGALEGRLHKQFAHIRTHGEWFEPTQELWVFINDHALDDPERICVLNRKLGKGAVGQLLSGRQYRLQRASQGLSMPRIQNEWDVVLLGKDERKRRSSVA